MARLLFIAPDAGFFVSHRLNLARAAIDSGYEVAVACPPGLAVETIKSAGAQHVPIRLIGGSKNPFRELASLFDIGQTMRSFQPDALHLISPKPVIYGGILARTSGIPYIVAVSGLGHAFINESAAGRLLRAGVTLAYRTAVNGAGATLIFQNDDDLTTFRTARILHHERFAMIPGSGTDLERITVKPLPSGRTIVVFPGRLLLDKGVMEFVEAARILRDRNVDATFRLLGDPDPKNPTSVTRRQLEAWIREGIIEWKPYTMDIDSALAEAHIVALPSYREGFPKTLIDAAAAGRPAVATDVPGCRHAILNGSTGLLCQPRDPHSLADVLQSIIRDRGLQEAMGAAARRHAEANFDVEEVTKAHLKLYASACSIGRNRRRHRWL